MEYVPGMYWIWHRDIWKIAQIIVDDLDPVAYVWFMSRQRAFKLPDPSIQIGPLIEPPPAPPRDV